MACEIISKSRLAGCKKGFSGIKAVGFLPFTKLTLTADETFEGTGLTGSVYRYEVPEGGSYEETGTTDKTTRTSVWTGKAVVPLPHLDKATRNQVKLMAYDNPIIFLELYNGDILIAGSEFGCNLNTQKLATGTARKDMAGFTLEFESEEKRPVVFVGATGSTIYNSAINMTGAINPA